MRRYLGSMGLAAFVSVMFVLPSTCDGVIFSMEDHVIDLTDAVKAATDAKWISGVGFVVNKEGFGLLRDTHARYPGWIETKPIAIGLSWRPAHGVSARVAVEGSSAVVTIKRQGNSIEYPSGEVYVRHSPDLKNWSTWQSLENAEPQTEAEKQTFARYFKGSITIPQREQAEYKGKCSEYMHLDVPWESDEEATVRWILEKDPGFFARHIPFVGYVQFLYERDFKQEDRIKSIKISLSWGVGGVHSMPKDPSVYKKSQDGKPWSFRAESIQ